MNDVADLMMRFRTEGEDAAVRALNQVDNKIDQVDRSARSAKGGLGSMFSTAGGFVLGGAINMVAGSILNVGKSILFANANAEQAKMSLETVLGSQDAAVAKFEELQKFAAETPFAFPELVTATINLESFGLKSTEWIGTIGDTASAMGKSVDQVTQAVLDAQTGQYERLKELGIMASVEGDKVKFKYMKDGQEIVETVDRNNQQMINSTLTGIWNSKYDGAMEKQSQSFIGRWSTLKDNINMKLQEVSGGIFGFASSAIGVLNSVFANGFFDTFDGILGPSVSGFLKNLLDLGSGIIDAFGSGKGVQQLIESLPQSWQGAAGAILKFSDSLGDLWSAFRAGGLSEVMSVFVEEASNLGEAVLELGGTIDWSGLGQAILNGAKTSMDAIGDFAPIVGQVIADKFKSIEWTSFLTADSFEFGTAIGVAIRGAIERVGPAVVDAISGITWDDVVKALEAGLVVAIAIPGALAAATVAVASAIGGMIAGIVFGEEVDFDTVVAELESGLAAAFTVDNFQAVGTAIIDGIAAGMDAAVTATLDGTVSGVVLSILTPFLTAGTWLVSAGSSAIVGMASGIAGAVESTLSPIISSAISAVISPFAGAGSWLYGAGAAIMQGLIGGIQDMIPSLDGILGAITSRIPIKKGPEEVDRKLLVPTGGFIMSGLIDGITASIPALNSTLAGITGMIGAPPIAVAAAGTRALSPSSGGGGSVNYFVFESGSFVGRGAQAEIERMVADGSAKRVNKGVSRGRLESSY